MPAIEHLELGAQFDSTGGQLSIRVGYVPVVQGTLRHDLMGDFYVSIPGDTTSAHHLDLRDRYDRLEREIAATWGSDELEIDGRRVVVTKPIAGLDLLTHRNLVTSYPEPEGDPPFVNVDFRGLSGTLSQRSIYAALPFTTSLVGWYSAQAFTEGQLRLISSIVTTLTSHSWDDFRHALSLESPARAEVFISYRKGHEEFARALAERLGKEGFVPWFDEWEIRAGDSVTGKIEEGLRRSVAFIPVMTADYEAGKWATEEMESAIHRRIEEDYPIIPVLLDDCPKPELIRQP